MRKAVARLKETVLHHLLLPLLTVTGLGERWVDALGGVEAVQAVA